MSTDSRSVLAVRGLSYHYGKVSVWEQVSFDLGRGEIAFLVGANGSGKSTLLRCLAGWSLAKAGTMLLEDRPFPGTDRTQRAKITFVPDVPSFYDDLTAEEHIDLVLKANRKEHLNDEATRLLTAFGLQEHRGQFPSSYSRGMRVKLGLVLALILESSVLLLDEPFGPLDVRTSSALGTELLAAAEKGTSILVSHHQTDIEITPDKILRLQGGKLEVTAGQNVPLSTELTASSCS
jgi:ABC-2 type transport system ATP-binding protein